MFWKKIFLLFFLFFLRLDPAVLQAKKEQEFIEAFEKKCKNFFSSDDSFSKIKAELIDIFKTGKKFYYFHQRNLKQTFKDTVFLQQFFNDYAIPMTVLDESCKDIFLIYKSENPKDMESKFIEDFFTVIFKALTEAILLKTSNVTIDLAFFDEALKTIDSKDLNRYLSYFQNIACKIYGAAIINFPNFIYESSSMKMITKKFLDIANIKKVILEYKEYEIDLVSGIGFLYTNFGLTAARNQCCRMLKSELEISLQGARFFLIDTTQIKKEYKKTVQKHFSDFFERYKIPLIPIDLTVLENLKQHDFYRQEHLRFRKFIDELNLSIVNMIRMFNRELSNELVFLIKSPWFNITENLNLTAVYKDILYHAMYIMKAKIFFSHNIKIVFSVHNDIPALQPFKMILNEINEASLEYLIENSNPAISNPAIDVEQNERIYFFPAKQFIQPIKLINTRKLFFIIVISATCFGSRIFFFVKNIFKKKKIKVL